MKKVGVLIILIILTITLAVAQINDSALKDIGTENIKDKSNDALNKQVKLPEWMNNLAKILFRTEGEIRVSQLVILLMVWIFLFLVIENILKLTPFFKGGTAWVAAFAITIIFSVTGTIKIISNFFFGFGDFFSFLEEWEVGKLIFFVIVISMIYLIYSKIISLVERHKGKAEAEQAGEEAGAGISAMRGAWNAIKENYRS